MNTFDRSLQNIMTQNPFLGAKLFGVDTNERFEVFQDPKDTLNVNIFDHVINTIMYDGIPRDEILQKIDSFEAEFGRYPVLFIYGIANGLFVKLLLQNQNHAHIIVIEPQIELLYIALHLIDFSGELEKKRIHIFHESEIDFVKAEAIFANSEIKVFCKTYHMEPNLPYYEHYYADSMIRCNNEMIRGIQHVITGLGNDTTDALIGLEWHLTNVSKMVETPTLFELIAKAKTTKTAIIISTGPSLDKQLPLLKTIQEHVTLLSVDASLPVLEKYGIKPDIVFSIERVAETAEFYRRTSKGFQKDIICAISSLAHPLLVESAAESMIIQMSMRPFGYTRYFAQHEYGYMGIGMSAANMAYELAFHAKFETIILIGQDLSYGKDGKSHSEGHVFGQYKQRKDDMMVEAYGGEGSVRTSSIWNMFRNFFQTDIYVASKEGIVTVNSTEGGARIHGAIEMSFAEAIKVHVDTSTLKSRIELTSPALDKIYAQKIAIEEKVITLEKYVEAMQLKVSKLFEKIAESVEELDRIKARKNLEKVNYDKLAELMKEIDEIKTYFDDQEFTDIFIDATQSLIVHHELEIAKIQVRPILDDEDRRLKMIDWIYAHKTWLFSLAGIMEAELVAIKRRGRDSLYVHKAKLSDDGITISGHFYNYKDGHHNFEIELLIDGESVMIKSLVGQKGTFSVSIPSRLYNDQVHSISVREKNTRIILMGMPENRLLLSEDKNKAQFMESIDHVDSEKIRDLYCPGAIGFLASEENLADEEFVGYIKELIERFPHLELKGFCFNDLQELTLNKVFNNEVIFASPSNILEVCESIEVYILNSKSQLSNRKLYDHLVYMCPNIFSFQFTPLGKKRTLEEDDKYLIEHVFLQNVEFFNLKKVDNSFYKTIYSDFFKKKLDFSKTVYEFKYFDVVALAMGNAKYKKFYFEMNKKYLKYLSTR